MKIDIDINIKVSKFVKTFVIADLFLIGGWGMIIPIFAVFILDRVPGATLVTVGIAASIYFFLKSIIQIPVANFLDKTEGEKDDFYVLVGSLILAGVAAFLFTLVNQTWHLYVVQAVHAIAFGFYIPAWTGMFSRHMDKKHEALDWSLNSTSVGLAAGVTGLVGGALANWVGFNIVFVLTGLLSITSALALMTVPDLIFPKKETIQDIYLKNQHVAPHK